MGSRATQAAADRPAWPAAVQLTQAAGAQPVACREALAAP